MVGTPIGAVPTWAIFAAIIGGGIWLVSSRRH
jgi:hypothetical protein